MLLQRNEVNVNVQIRHKVENSNRDILTYSGLQGSVLQNGSGLS